MLSAGLVGPAGSVIAVEPTPSNARPVEASRPANGFDQVTMLQVAGGPAPGLPIPHRSHSNGITSAAPDDRTALLEAGMAGYRRVETLAPRARRTELIRLDRPGNMNQSSQGLMHGRLYPDWLVGPGYSPRIMMPDGSLTRAAPDASTAEHEARGTDHLDLLAEPLQGADGIVAAPGGGPATHWLRRRQRRTVAWRNA
ncbi:hypothetical protein [Lichenicola sp.]|uniref:hypothetical protein n=1 Tax=Lichenicola sp. TaxID=2804529 RepID=UPI003AFF8624